MKHLPFALLHSLGFSQRELSSISQSGIDVRSIEDGGTDIKIFRGLFSAKRLGKIEEERKSVDTEKIEGFIRSHAVKLIIRGEEGYPTQLERIPNPPFIVYAIGSGDFNEDAIAVVGSRENTSYSEMVLKKIIPELIAAGFAIVSGGASGVDSLAHEFALSAGGNTISVIGTGIDRCYPASNRRMFKRIVDAGGTIVSIFRLDTKPDKRNFPVRNEIIAGLSKGVLVTEAKERSGTLITARLALELNKDVFVIPGDIGRPTSFGSNALIRDGLGKLVQSAEDILIEYGLPSERHITSSELSPEMLFSDELERIVYQSLQKRPMEPSEIADTSGYPIEDILMRLSMMEITGHIRLTENGSYGII